MYGQRSMSSQQAQLDLHHTFADVTITLRLILTHNNVIEDLINRGGLKPH